MVLEDKKVRPIFDIIIDNILSRIYVDKKLK